MPKTHSTSGAARAYILAHWEPWEWPVRPRRKRSADGLLTMGEAAARLGITTAQVKAHVDDGGLRFVNVGRGTEKPRYRFTPSDLDQFILSRTGEHHTCRSIAPKRTEASTSSISKSVVIGFTARRNAVLAAKRKRSKP
jgi:excisionase family DNA binding protein